jgi:hypothetical protein
MPTAFPDLHSLGPDVRKMETGMIRLLEIRGGLLFFMEIADEPVACEMRRLHALAALVLSPFIKSPQAAYCSP